MNLLPKNFKINSNTEVRFLGAILLIIVAILSFSFVMGLKIKRNDTSVPTKSAQRSFPEVKLIAQAGYVFDLRTKEVLFAKEENRRMPLASITKIMSALVAEEMGDPESTVVITRRALMATGDSGFRIGERWRLKDLLDFSLLTSSNDGMKAIALALGGLNNLVSQAIDPEENFVRIMNEKASELGLRNTYFFNETGLDETDYMGGAYGSASDVSVLLEYILSAYPDLLLVTRDSSATLVSENQIYNARNTNRFAGEIPGLRASKTGFTDLGGGNLAIVFDPEIGRPIVVVVLGSTTQGRFEDVRALVDATMEYITGENIRN